MVLLADKKGEGQEANEQQAMKRGAGIRVSQRCNENELIHTYPDVHVRCYCRGCAPKDINDTQISIAMSK